MPVATRSSSRPLASSIIPNSPAKRWRAEPHLPSEHPRGPAEEDLDDIDGTTLHQPPPESSISSGSDSDPDSDSDNPISSVTPINKQSAGFSRTKNPHSNPSPTVRKGPLSLPVKSPRGKGVKISHVEVPASPLDNPDIRGQTRYCFSGANTALHIPGLRDTSPILLSKSKSKKAGEIATWAIKGILGIDILSMSPEL
ncbi:hypothetical protein CIHG_02192 [Coccidioides immitis H538.4]|uniref:Uncharacterized protein n=1 Tax=Coccidioides immitis H538.4 TaxID=396776 RepID=A0A0J8RHP4_COCIT|nr:hypothetical protein CIHG_02192 [Coccidioides immitis H538.4]